MLSSRSSLSRFATDRMFRPYSRAGVAMLYGATGTRDSWFALNDAFWPSGEIKAITEAGFPVGSVDTLDGWGNDALLDDLTDMKAEGDAAYFASGRWHLLGASAGGLTVLNWAKANPALVKSLTLLIPVLDVQDVYTNNRGSFASVISTAYGGAPPDSHNPADNYSSFADIPIKLYYSTTDTITPLAITQAFISGVGDNVEGVNMGAQGHFWDYAVFTPASIVEFLEAND